MESSSAKIERVKNMHLGSKRIEWIITAGLFVVMAIELMLLVAGTAANTLQTTLIHVLLLLVFAGEGMIAIILLRIYDAIEAKKGKK